MKVNEYIKQKFQTFGIQLSEADLLEMCLNANVSGEGEMNQDCHVHVSVAIAKFIPSLLLRAQSMSEGGCSSGIFKGLRIITSSYVASTIYQTNLVVRFRYTI